MEQYLNFSRFFICNAFICLQVVRQDQVERGDVLGASGVFTPSQPRERWQRRRTTMKLRVSQMYDLHLVCICNIIYILKDDYKFILFAYQAQKLAYIWHFMHKATDMNHQETKGESQYVICYFRLIFIFNLICIIRSCNVNILPYLHKRQRIKSEYLLRDTMKFVLIPFEDK